MSTVAVKFSHADPGNCRVYYRTVNGNVLLCTQEEAPGVLVWYKCVDDGCWEEPISAISNCDFSIEEHAP